MEPAIPAAAVLDSTLALPQVPQALPSLICPPPLLSSEHEIHGRERASCLWRPWLSSANDPPVQVRKLVDWAAGRAKPNSEFHHPVRLFWPKSRSFDYLYTDGEILLQNFPVQATINLYEDSDSEDEDGEEEEETEEEGEEEEEEENEERKEEGKGGKGPGSVPHKATSLPHL